MRRISTQFYNSDQSWVFDLVAQLGKFKFRVLIRRNAYDSQSYVHGFAFDPLHLKWNLLVDRPIETAACRDASYVRAKEDIKPFESDAESVLKELLAIAVEVS